MIGDILQPTHLIFILVVALIFLGPKRLPEAGKALGKGIRDFRGAVAGITEETTVQAPAPAAVNQPVADPVAAPVSPAAPAPASTQHEVFAMAPQPGASAALLTTPTDSAPLALTSTSGSVAEEPEAPVTSWVDIHSTTHSE